MKAKKIIFSILGAVLITLGFAQGTQAVVSTKTKTNGVDPNIERTRQVNEKIAADKATAAEQAKNKQAAANAQNKARHEAAAAAQAKKAAPVNTPQKHDVKSAVQPMPAKSANGTVNGVAPNQTRPAIANTEAGTTKVEVPAAKPAPAGPAFPAGSQNKRDGKGKVGQPPVKANVSK